MRPRQFLHKHLLFYGLVCAFGILLVMYGNRQQKVFIVVVKLHKKQKIVNPFFQDIGVGYAQGIPGLPPTNCGSYWTSRLSTTPDHVTPLATRLNDVQYPWISVGEALAGGYTSAQDVFNA